LDDLSTVKLTALGKECNPLLFSGSGQAVVQREVLCSPCKKALEAIYGRMAGGPSCLQNISKSRIIDLESEV
jgi:hypothetical protein